MGIREREMPEFKALRLELEAWARTELETSNRVYVETFHRRMDETNDNVAKVIDETTSLLKGPVGWHDVITASFDVEYWMDRCRQAVLYVGSAPLGGDAQITHPGVWLTYHIDGWYVIAYGLLDRIRRLVALTCRHVMRPKDAKWIIVEKALNGDVETLKEVIDETRNAIAHGGGVVEALKDDKLLEPYIAVGRYPGASDAIDVFGNFYESMAQRQDTWFLAIKQGTQTIFAISEALFQKLRTEAFS